MTSNRWFGLSLVAGLTLGLAGVAEAKKPRPPETPTAAPADAKDDVETGKTRAKEMSGKDLDKAATEAKVGKINTQVGDLDKALKASEETPAAAASSRKARLAAEATAAATGKKPTTAPTTAPADPKAAAAALTAPPAAADPAQPMTRKQRLAAEAAAAEAAKKSAK
ncbi:MAG TPA: hypothetical protein VK986_09290 [Tepidisphaeraceae bacterium]|nr:hypothetical protein [Tepidisphaeraceae bacterium]